MKTFTIEKSAFWRFITFAGIVLFLIGFGGGMYVATLIKQPCPDIVTIRTDTTTVFIHDTVSERPQQVFHGRPTPRRVSAMPTLKSWDNTAAKWDNIAANAAKTPSDSSEYHTIKYGDTTFIFKCNPSACDSIVEYADTFSKPNDYRIVLYEYLQHNRILARDVEFSNLRPIEVRTITETRSIVKKQALVKVFLGAGAGVKLSGKELVGYGGKLMADFVLADRHSVGIEGGAGAYRGQYFGEAGISFKEKIIIKKP